MSDVSDRLSNKSQLQELIQKSNLEMPLYQTIVQGSPHNLGFKSSVVVDGVKYNSEITFPNKKAAENHIAEVAFEGTSQKLKSDALSSINKDPIFCKSIVNEYAAKMNIAIPTYQTVQAETLVPVFTSSLVFNGVPFSGEACRTKQDSEQLAARAVILSILGRSETENAMSVIIKSKSKKYNDLLGKEKDAPGDCAVAKVVNPETNLVTPPRSQVKELVVDTRTDDNSMGVLLPCTADHHEPVVAKLVKTESDLSIQPQIEGKESEITKIDDDNIVCGTGGGPTIGKKTRRNQNKKRNKKMRIAAQIAAALEPTAAPTDDVHLDSVSP